MNRRHEKRITIAAVSVALKMCFVHYVLLFSLSINLPPQTVNYPTGIFKA